MTTLVAYSTVAFSLTAALWALGIRWIHNLNAADTYRVAWTKDRNPHDADVRESMQRQRRKP